MPFLQYISPYRCFHDEGYKMILRLFRACGGKFAAHTVNTLAKLLHIFVRLEILGYFRIA